MTTERVLITSDTTSKVILIQGIRGSITPQISESHFSSIKPKLVWNIWRFTDFFFKHFDIKIVKNWYYAYANILISDIKI